MKAFFLVQFFLFSLFSIQTGFCLELFQWGSLGVGYFLSAGPSSMDLSSINDTVTSASAGHNFFLLLTQSGRVFSRGQNDWGQLCRGFTSSFTSEDFGEVFFPVPIVKISAGGYHSLFLGQDGLVYSCGKNETDLLGRDGDATIPLSINFTAEVVTDVKAGTAMSVLLTQNNNIYTFGQTNLYNFLGRSGAGGVPLQVDLFGLKVAQVSLGWDHVLVLTQNGSLISFGDNSQQHLSRVNETSSSLMPGFSPMPENILKGLETIQTIAAGAFHTLILTNNGTVYSFGFQKGGRLGRAGDSFTPLPINSTYLGDEKIVSIAAGLGHSVLLSAKGTIFTFGGECNFYVRGHQGCEDFGLPVNETISEKHIVSISSYGFLTLAFADRDKTNNEVLEFPAYPCFNRPCRGPSSLTTSGTTDRIPDIFAPPPTPPKKLPLWVVPTIVILAIIFLTLIIITALLIARDRRKTTTIAVEPTHLVELEDINRLQNVTLGIAIGSGKFGEVYQGAYNGNQVALKKLKGNEDRTSIIRELKLLSSLNHPNVIRTFGYYSNNDEFYIVNEFCGAGSLNSLLAIEKELFLVEPWHLVSFCKNIAAGMIYLHSENILHRDLRTSNCLVKRTEGNKFEVKIGDFGLSVRLDENAISAETGERPIRWAAVEVCQNNQFEKGSDVWSFSILLWEIFTFGQVPYSEMSNNEVISNVVSGYRLEKPEKCPDSLYSLMQRCWVAEPSTRPSFTEIFSFISKEVSSIELHESEEIQNVNSQSVDYNSTIYNS